MNRQNSPGCFQGTKVWLENIDYKLVFCSQAVSFTNAHGKAMVPATSLNGPKLKNMIMSQFQERVQSMCDAFFIWLGRRN